MDCKKCRLSVRTKDQPYLYCNGLCAAIYHATCAELNEVELAAVSPPNKNSFWLCDECLAEFVQWRKERCEKKLEPVALVNSEPKCVLQRDVDDLKNKVESILSALASYTNCHADSLSQHSTPNSSQPSGFELKEANLNSEGSFVSDAANQLPNSVDEDDNFSLLLTNIDGSVSEEDVRRMVYRCLGVRENECKTVRKLVPRWVDCTTLDFVSFKIVLDRKWKSPAMMSSTWPNNIKFREFKKRLCTWKPDAV